MAQRPGLQRFAAIPAVLAVLSLVSCGIRPSPRFVAGPEAVGMRNRLRGGLLVADEDNAIVAFALPDCSRRVVRPAPARTEWYWPFLHAVSAPDRSGWV